MAIGPLREVSLLEARDAAGDARALIRKGVDPLDQKQEAREAAKAEIRRNVTFKAYAEGYVPRRQSAWKSPVQRRGWRSSQRDHVYPSIGHLPVADVGTDDVLAVLRPIWTLKRKRRAQFASGRK